MTTDETGAGPGSTTRPTDPADVAGRTGTDTRPPRQEPPRLGRGVLVAVGLSLLAGLAVALVGLPDGVALFDTTLGALTVPVAVFVALAGISLAGAVTARTTWRVVDITVAAVLGVVGALLFLVWNLAVYPGVSALLVPPFSAAVVGVWLLPGVLGGLVVRKPGAALFTELVAATLSALVGNQWGFATVWYGLLEGLGAEFVLALLLYRYWRLPTALLAGAGAGVVVGVLDTTVYYPELTTGVQVAYIVVAVASGVVVAGLGSWALVRAMARTGVLSPLASGRDGRRV